MNGTSMTGKRIAQGRIYTIRGRRAIEIIVILRGLRVGIPMHCALNLN